ncbi:MAG: hypothetical protein K2Y37_21280 [Pirellulales bacterium]|nr:hypothetical protein [Pirellulales bacterium]
MVAQHGIQVVGATLGGREAGAPNQSLDACGETWENDYAMVNVQLNDTVAAALSAKAAAQGLTLQEYLEGLVLPKVPRTASRLTLDEFERLFDEEATSGPSPTGTFSRVELYSDHD